MRCSADVRAGADPLAKFHLHLSGVAAPGGQGDCVQGVSTAGWRFQGISTEREGIVQPAKDICVEEGET